MTQATVPQLHSTLNFIPIENKPSLLFAKGMLAVNEFAILYSLGRGYRGEGRILDLGSFCGASAYCLGTGLADSDLRLTKDRPIHCFDMFENHNGRTDAFINRFFYGHCDSWANLIASEFEARRFSGFRDIFDFQTSQVRQFLTVHHGNLLNTDISAWTHTKIEIANVDIAKNASLNDFIIRNFYPKIVPGGYIFQQDIEIPMHWYLLLSMYLLRGQVQLDFYRKPSGWLFRLDSEITAGAAEDCISVLHDVGDADVLEMYADCRTIFPRDLHTVINSCFAYCFIEKFNAGRFDALDKLLKHFEVGIDTPPAAEIKQLCLDRGLMPAA